MKHQSAIAIIVGLLCVCGCAFQRDCDQIRRAIDDIDKRTDQLEKDKAGLDAQIGTIKGVGTVVAAAVTMGLGFVGIYKSKPKGA